MSNLNKSAWNFVRLTTSKLLERSPLKIDIFQQSLLIASAIYRQLRVQNFTYIRSDLIILLYNV